MASTDEFLRKLENILVLNFFLISISWYILRFDVLKVAVVGFTLSTVTTIRYIREFNFREVIR